MVSLEGKVDAFGLVSVSGTITPLDPKLDTDLKVVFQNVEMPKFSAYSIPLAGREIASGRLDLGLGYQLITSELVGENNIVLRDFELGQKVEHPGAMSLPLGLALALLKGPDGKIAKLAEALALRPELLLEIPGVVDREADGLALRTGKLDRTVEERIADMKDFGDDEAMFAQRQREVLEALFAERAEVEDADAALEELRLRYTTLTDAADGKPEEIFDALAYTNGLRRQLINLLPLEDAELDILPLERANNTQAAILTVDPDLARRIRLGEPQDVRGSEDSDIQMKVRLTVGTEE